MIGQDSLSLSPKSLLALLIHTLPSVCLVSVRSVYGCTQFNTQLQLRMPVNSTTLTDHRYKISGRQQNVFTFDLISLCFLLTPPTLSVIRIHPRSLLQTATRTPTPTPSVTIAPLPATRLPRTITTTRTRSRLITRM